MTDQVIALRVFYNGGAILVANHLKNISIGYQRATQAWNAHEWDLAI